MWRSVEILCDLDVVVRRDGMHQGSRADCTAPDSVRVSRQRKVDVWTSFSPSSSPRGLSCCLTFTLVLLMADGHLWRLRKDGG
jgi:hypothetical protein